MPSEIDVIDLSSCASCVRCEISDSPESKSTLLSAALAVRNDKSLR